jgi:hypothetical protein
MAAYLANIKTGALPPVRHAEGKRQAWRAPKCFTFAAGAEGV